MRMISNTWPLRSKIGSDGCTHTCNYKETWGLGRKIKSKIKLPDAYARDSFSPSDEAVELLFEGG